MLCWYNCTWNQIAYLRLASYCMFASAAKSNHCMLVRWQHYNGGSESSQLRHFSGTFAYIRNWQHFPSFASHCLFEAHLSGSDWQLYHRVTNSNYIPPNFKSSSQIQPPKFQIRPPKFQIRPPKFQIQSPKFQIQPPKFQIQRPKCTGSDWQLCCYATSWEQHGNNSH